MGYWKMIYGDRSKEFMEGFFEGLRSYAIRHDDDGRLYVGKAQVLLYDLLTEIKKDFGCEDKRDDYLLEITHPEEKEGE